MWKVVDLRNGNWAVAHTENGRKFISFSQVDADWLCETLNAASATTIRLYCKNVACRSKGSFIDRSYEDVKKFGGSLKCDDCGKPFQR